MHDPYDFLALSLNSCLDPFPGEFFDSSFPIRLESIALFIRSGPSFTGCFFIILSSQSRDTRAEMKVFAFITDSQSVGQIKNHLKLTFVAEKPPPSRVFKQAALMADEERNKYF